MLFPDAVRNEDDIKRLVDAAGIPVSINLGFGIRSRPTTPLFSMRQFKAWGVKRISLPRMLPAAAIKSMSAALAVMRHCMETEETADRPDLLASIEDIMTLMGYEDARALEAKLLQLERS
jgi:2-methylisocitrate lyase-like PEP mutase family enzyme